MSDCRLLDLSYEDSSDSGYDLSFKSETADFPEDKSDPFYEYDFNPDKPQPNPELLDKFKRRLPLQPDGARPARHLSTRCAATSPRPPPP
jgi:hypothetical protein